MTSIAGSGPDHPAVFCAISGGCLVYFLWGCPEEEGKVELPTGTVTFLFTDLEVSTRLWEREADAMSGALARHDLMLREVVSAHGGQRVKWRDGVHAVFETAHDAIAAAIDAQQALVAES